MGVGLSVSVMVSATTPSLSTCPSRREAPSEVGNVVDFVAILLNGVDKVEKPTDFFLSKSAIPIFLPVNASSQPLHVVAEVLASPE